MSRKEFKRQNTRQASAVRVGGFRPTNEPLATHFGLRPVALPGEEWPSHAGEPLAFICQLNLTAAPFVPPILQDIKLITFFINPNFGILSEENGTDWRVRAYSSLDGLVQMTPPPNAPRFVRGAECSWELCDDQPNHDDPELIVPKGFDASDVEMENVARTKIGGYASTIQSEPWWGNRPDHPSAPRYCLQINSEEKARLAWGDAGTVYIARGTAPDCGGHWFLDWQCF
jgi:uncharacterized protein YwqG